MSVGAGGPPREVVASVRAALGSPPGGELEVSRIGGGCIHPAARIRTDRGASAFLKWSPEPGPGPFGVEARGLEALAHRGGLLVPEVLAWNAGDSAERGWLLLEYLPPFPADSSTDERLGRGLARLHRPLDAEEAIPGWEEDGWIGPLHQENPRVDSWPDFWREARILPQLRLAAPTLGSGTRAAIERLLDRMDHALEGWESDGLCLLHGDLWSGNVLVTRGGRPALVDPAAYRGHREVDLAMMELFGGFGEGVFAAYRSASPTRPGYRERRRPAYQLYPLLVHVNLFGEAYAGRSDDAARAALAGIA